MSNEEAQAVRPVYPPMSTPTIFADAVVNVANTAQVAKFYLARTDPSITNQREQARVVAQIIMPLPSFLNAYVFFEAIVKGMLDQKLISSEQLDQMRNALEVEGK